MLCTDYALVSTVQYLQGYRAGILKYFETQFRCKYDCRVSVQPCTDYVLVSRVQYLQGNRAGILKYFEIQFRCKYDCRVSVQSL